MAGINSALVRVIDNKNEGMVVAKGILGQNVLGHGIKCACSTKERKTSCDFCDNTEYIIIRLGGNQLRGSKDHGLITQYNGTDIHIADNVNVGDNVILMINDNWNATWTVAKSLAVE